MALFASSTAYCACGGLLLSGGGFVLGEVVSLGAVLGAVVSGGVVLPGVVELGLCP